MSPVHINDKPITPSSGAPIDATAARRPTEPITLNSPNLIYTEESILANYTYHAATVKKVGDKYDVTPTEKPFEFKTERKVAKTGLVCNRFE